MSRNLLNLLVVSAIFLISAVKISLPTFNLEWYFLDLANFFNERSVMLDLKDFKLLQLNTSFYSLLISQLKLENFLDQVNLVRLLNVTTLPILLISFNIIINFFNKEIFLKDDTSYIAISLYIIFTPVVFLLVGKAFPDYLSFFLIVCSIALFVKNNFFFFTILLILAAILKPIALCVFPFLFLISYCKNGKLFDKIIISSLITATIITLVYVYKIDGHMFGGNHENYKELSLLSSMSNYLIYISYLSILLLFFVPYKFLEFFKKKEILKGFIIFVLSLFFLLLTRTGYGEINYGYISSLINIKYINSLIMVLTFFFYLIISSEIFFNGNKLEKLFFLALNFSVLILAVLVERPTQRYLLYIYPFYFLFVFYYFISENFKKILVINILCFFFINYFQFFYQKNFSNVAYLILDDVKEKNILEETNSLDIFHIIGYKFNKNRIYGKNDQYKYIINYCKKKNNDKDQIAIYSVELINITLKKICISKKNDIR